MKPPRDRRWLACCGTGVLLPGMALASLLTSIVPWFGRGKYILYAVQSMVFVVAYWKLFYSFKSSA